MANIKSAKKRARQNIARRTLRHGQRSSVRTAIRRTLSLAEAGDKDGSRAAFRLTQQVIDRMAGKGVIHKNKAARHKRRLSNRLKAL